MGLGVPVAAKVDKDDCCWAINTGGEGRAGVFNPELGAVGNDAVVWIGVYRMRRSNGSTIVDGEDGVLGDSPAGVKLWWSNCSGDSLGVTDRIGEGGLVG